MNKKQRVFNAMEGKPVDKVPVSFYTHVLEEKDNAVTAYIRWVKATGMDMIDIEPDGYYALLTENPMKTMDDWKKFRPYKKDHPYVINQKDRAKRVADGLWDDAAVYYMFFTPLAIFKHTIDEGQLKIMEFINEDKTIVKQVLDVLEENNFMFMEEMADTGIDGAFVSMQNAEFWRFTRDEYEEFLKPYDERLINKTNDLYKHNIGHLCSWHTEETNIGIDLERYKDYDFQTMNWGVYQPKSFTMKEGKNFFTKAKCVMGGFDRNPEGVLYSGSEREIKDFTCSLIEETGRDGFIISADCSIVHNTPDRNVRAVVEAAEEYETLK